MAESKSQGILVLVAVLVMAGLGGAIFYLVRHQYAPFPPVPPDAKSQAAAAGAPIDINVYVDGSESMWHLQNAGQGSNYLSNFLNNFRTTLDPLTGGKPPHSWKFGKFDKGRGKDAPASVLPLDDVRQLVNAPKGVFSASKTPIEVAVDDEPKPEDPGALRIIITDLYQTDYDTAKFQGPLGEKYLADDAHAVEIFAIRNPFDGEVEDLPGLGDRALTKAADTMPFYVIVAGRTPDVLRVREAFLNTAGDGIADAMKEHRAIEMLFTRNSGEVSQTAPIIEVPSRRKPGDNAPDDTWERKTNDAKASFVMVSTKRADEQREFTLVTLRQSGKFRVKWCLPPIESNPGHVETTGRPETSGDCQPSGEAAQRGGKSNLSLEVHAFLEQKIDAAPAKGQKHKPASFESTEVQLPRGAVTPASCGGDSAFRCAVIDNTRLQQKGRYLFRFDVIATRPELGARESFFEPGTPLMRQWNITTSEAVSMSRNPAAKFPAVEGVAGQNPGMTPQLAAFLQALQATVFNSPVHIVSYYLYVEAK